MRDLNIFVVRIYSKLQYLFISFFWNFSVDSTNSCWAFIWLSWNLSFFTLCAEYFYIFQKISAIHSYTEEIGCISIQRYKLELISLYISQLKWWKKPTKSLSMLTLIVVKSQAVDWIKLDLVPLPNWHIPREILRYVLYILQEGGSITGSATDIHNRVSHIPEGKKEKEK